MKASRNWPMKRMEFVINGVEMSDEAIKLKWDTNKKVQAARGTLMCPAESSCERVRIHRSRFDLHVALTAAASAFYIGQLLLRARSQYDYSGWHVHFDSLEEAMAWREEVVTVSLVSPYAAMVRVVAVAADFVRSHDPHISGIDEDFRDNLQVKHLSGDAIQGGTLEAMVLTLPPHAAEWTEWLASPPRILTVFSRYYRFVVMNEIDFTDHRSDARRSMRASACHYHPCAIPSQSQNPPQSPNNGRSSRDGCMAAKLHLKWCQW